MRVDREAFLFLAAALFACHAEHRRAEEVEKPLPAPPAQPEPEPEPALPVAAQAVDAGDASSAPDAASDAQVSESGDAAPAAPTARSLAELRKQCAALPAANPAHCPNLRRQMCQTALTEYAPVAATRAVDCLTALEDACDICGIRVCMLKSLGGLPAKKVAECQSAAKSADQTSEGYGQVMGPLCETYASGMTAPGRARFTQCLKKNMGVGVRFCLWDPSVTPCTEKSEIRPGQLFPTPE